MTSSGPPRMAGVTRAGDDDRSDLGFGAVVSREGRLRLLNRDGTFNVERRGLHWFESLSAYHALLTMTWPQFFALLVVFYVVANAFFALGYLACGPGALVAPDMEWPPAGFWRAFFFSVQTFATIGYGHVHPSGVAANALVTVESLFGLLGFALFTGILFARFSRPSARVLFSDHAIVAPFRGGQALMFRLVNVRKAELLEVEVRVILTWFEPQAGARRSYHQLRLEREKVSFFPLALTVVHPITDDSPLAGIDEPTLHERRAELLVQVRATDEGSQATVYARSSYGDGEILWGQKFTSVFTDSSRDGVVAVDVTRLHTHEDAPLAPPPQRPTA